MTTLAGTAGVAGSADGTGATARFNNPLGVALDSAFPFFLAIVGDSIVVIDNNAVLLLRHGAR